MSDTLTELKRLHEMHAALGPDWYAGGNGKDILQFDKKLDKGQLIATVAGYIRSEGHTSIGPETAALIVAAVNALPTLLHCVDVLGKLAQVAMTSGGTAGPDARLIATIAQATDALASLKGGA